MKPLGKTGVVVGGYLIALFISFAIVGIYIELSPSADRQASGGMSAFGDTLLWLLVFGVLATIPTGTALFFLRPVRKFWTALSLAALFIAATGVIAFAIYLGGRGAPMGSSRQNWAAFAVLRILLAPLVALASLLSAAFAPVRASRIGLLIAGVVDGSIFVGGAALWWLGQTR